MARELKAELVADGRLARFSEVEPLLPLGELTLAEVEQWEAQFAAIAQLMREKQRGQPLASENAHLVELMRRATHEGTAFIRARHAVERLKTTAPAEMLEAMNAASMRWVEVRAEVDKFVQHCPC